MTSNPNRVHLLAEKDAGNARGLAFGFRSPCSVFMWVMIAAMAALWSWKLVQVGALLAHADPNFFRPRLDLKEILALGSPFILLAAAWLFGWLVIPAMAQQWYDWPKPIRIPTAIRQLVVTVSVFITRTLPVLTAPPRATVLA